MVPDVADEMVPDFAMHRALVRANHQAVCELAAVTQQRIQHGKQNSLGFASGDGSVVRQVPGM